MQNMPATASINTLWTDINMEFNVFSENICIVFFHGEFTGQKEVKADPRDLSWQEDISPPSFSRL